MRPSARPPSRGARRATATPAAVAVTPGVATPAAVVATPAAVVATPAAGAAPTDPFGPRPEARPQASGLRDAPYKIAISALSPTTKRYAFGSAGERWIDTLRPIRLASMRPCRSVTDEPLSTIEYSISARSIRTFSPTAE